MDTLDLMRTYLAVIDTDSFTSAGHKIGKSKALVSKHVAELEGRLGARLLNRTTRSIGVTETGRAYYERALQILADFDDLEEAIRSESGMPRGLLKLTAPQTLGEMSIMTMATAFRAKRAVAIPPQRAAFRSQRPEQRTEPTATHVALIQ